MSQHWATISEAGALAGLRAMVWIHDHFGRTVFNIVLAPVMAYFLLRRPIARRASRDFLRRVKKQYPERLTGPVNLRLSFRHFFAFGQSLLDSVVAWTQPLSAFHMEPDELEMRASLVESRTGIVLIGSHFGNMEYSRSIAKSHKNLVVNILLYDQHAAKFAAMLRSSAPASRLNLIQVTDLDIELAFQLKEKVEHGEWVVIAGDRVPVGKSDNIRPATFFGAPANFPIGPFVLAKLLRCPVYLLHCFRMQGQYHLGMELFEKEIRPSREGKRRGYDQYVQKFATALERQVRREPLQWFNFYDFWGDQDTGSRELIVYATMMKTDFANCLTASIDIRVPFFDLDPAGVAWHGRYFQYFELARCELLEGINYSYEEMVDSGYLWPVADTCVRYTRPLTLNKTVRVTACLREWEMRLVIDYKIEDEDGIVYTKARTVQVPVDAETLELTLGSPQVLIDNVLHELQALEQQSG